jgi:hypothetical protein
MVGGSQIGSTIPKKQNWIGYETMAYLKKRKTEKRI